MITARQAVVLLRNREKKITNLLDSIDTTTNKFRSLYYLFRDEAKKLQEIGETAVSEDPEYQQSLDDLRKTYSSFLRPSYDCFGTDRGLVAIGLAYKEAEKITA
jgi:ABC-type transporter Mla subunit MlaD